MKAKSIFIFILILVLTGGAAYGVIWFRNRKDSDSGSPEPDINSGSGDNSSNINTGGTKPVNPITNSYDWWIKKLGHASFPLKMNSRGVEVYKLQRELNRLAAARDWAMIGEDGIWGFETETRFKFLFPSKTNVSESMFRAEFDPTNEVLT